MPIESKFILFDVKFEMFGQWIEANINSNSSEFMDKHLSPPAMYGKLGGILRPKLLYFDPKNELCRTNHTIRKILKTKRNDFQDSITDSFR